MKWCIGDNDGWPECNGPDCGEAEDCPYYKALMEEDSALREDLEDWKQRQKEKQGRNPAMRTQKPVVKHGNDITREKVGKMAVGTVLTAEDPNGALPVLRAELARRTTYHWKMRNGKEIPIRDMTDEHLKRTIEMLERMKATQDCIMENAFDAGGCY